MAMRSPSLFRETRSQKRSDGDRATMACEIEKPMTLLTSLRTGIFAAMAGSRAARLFSLKSVEGLKDDVRVHV